MYSRFVKNNIIFLVSIFPLGKMFCSLGKLYIAYCRHVFCMSGHDPKFTKVDFCTVTILTFCRSFVSAEERTVGMEVLVRTPPQVAENGAICWLGATLMSPFWHSQRFGSLRATFWTPALFTSFCSGKCHASQTYSWEGKDLTPTAPKCDSFSC